MTITRTRSSWFARIGCILSGLGLVGLSPYLWRTAYEIGLPVTAGPSRLWQIVAVLVLGIGAFLLYAGVEYRRPWRWLQRFLNTDNVMIAVMVVIMLILGTFAYFVLNGRLAVACWQGPFEWVRLVSCPFYIVVTALAWVFTALIGVLVYFGAVHHPILRVLASNQRGLLADDADDEYL